MQNLYLKSEVTRFPLADANGNCVTYLDNAGNIQALYTYDAFGVTVSSDGDMDDDFRFRFSSKYLDDETGVYFYGYRYYAPAIGRWLSRDPIGEEGGLLLYGFVDNDSINNFDNNGLTLVGGLNGVIGKAGKACCKALKLKAVYDCLAGLKKQLDEGMKDKEDCYSYMNFLLKEINLFSFTNNYYCYHKLHSFPLADERK